VKTANSADRAGDAVGDRVALPPVVYLPVAHVPDDATEGQAELRRLDDGRLAVMAYTSLDRLIDCCGEQQPWLLVRVAALSELRTQSGYAVVALDVPLPEELRHGGTGEVGPHG
jgi:hypothetical protein